MQITGGKVAYLRSVQPAQYETKRCEVEITFTLGEGETLSNQLDIAAKAAMDKVHEVVGLKAAPAAGTSKVTTTPKNTTPPATDPKADAAANMTAREQKAQAQKAPKTPPASTGAAISTGGERKPSDDGLDFDLDPGKPAEAPALTDKDLTAAVNKKHGELSKTLGQAAAPKVRELIAKYAGELPKQLRDIPADKRTEFLAALAELKAE